MVEWASSLIMSPRAHAGSRICVSIIRRCQVTYSVWPKRKEFCVFLGGRASEFDARSAHRTWRYDPCLTPSNRCYLLRVYDVFFLCHIAFICEINTLFLWAYIPWWLCVAAKLYSSLWCCPWLHVWWRSLGFYRNGQRLTPVPGFCYGAQIMQPNYANTIAWL